MRSESDGHLAAAGVPRASPSREGRSPPLAQSRDEPLPPDGRAVPRARRRGARAERLGRELRRASRRARARRSRAASRSTAKGRSRTCWSRPGIRGSSSVAPARVHAYEPHEYAAKVAVVGAGMAAATEWRNALAAGSEVVSIRRREPLRRPLNVPRAYFSKRGLAGFHRLAPAERVEVLHDLGQPSYPPGRDGTSTSGPFAERAAARIPGHRGDRLPQGLAGGRAARRPGRGARPRDARPVPRARARLDCSALTDDRAHALDRGRRRPMGVPRRRHDRRAPSTLPVRSPAAYVVHADRPHPVAPRRDAPTAPRGAGNPPLVGGRARRADARVRRRARRLRLRPRPSTTSPAGSRFRSG